MGGGYLEEWAYSGPKELPVTTHTVRINGIPHQILEIIGVEVLCTHLNVGV